jgi:hypothetical protein
MLQVRCPNCDAPMPFVEVLANREVLCLGCGRHFVIPDLRSTLPSSERVPAVKLIPLNIPYPPPPTESPGPGSEELPDPETGPPD